MAKFKAKASIFYDGTLYQPDETIDMTNDVAQSLLDRQLLEPVAAPKPPTDTKAKKES